jgi:hypothetical protein
VTGAVARSGRSRARRGVGRRSHAWVVVPAPRGDPIRVRYDLAGDVTLRTTGTFSFRLRATGRLPKEKPVPSRSFEGTVDLTRRITLVAGTRHSTIEGPYVVTGRVEGQPAATQTVPFSLAFDEGDQGAARVASIRVATPGLPPEDLEGLVRAFTDRFGPPPEPVRIGDALRPTDGIEVEESMKRTAFFLYLRSLPPGKQPLVAAPRGAVWIDGHEGRGEGEVVIVRAAVSQAQEGDSDRPPLPPENVHITYRAAIEGMRHVVVDGGWAARHDVALRRAFHYVARDFDYTVELEHHADLSTTRVPSPK